MTRSRQSRGTRGRSRKMGSIALTGLVATGNVCHPSAAERPRRWRRSGERRGPARDKPTQTHTSRFRCVPRKRPRSSAVIIGGGGRMGGCCRAVPPRHRRCVFMARGKDAFPTPEAANSRAIRTGHRAPRRSAHSPRRDGTGRAAPRWPRSRFG